MARVSLDAEPSISVLSPEENTYNVQLMRIMNWYSAEKAKSDARKYMRDYVKAKMPSELNTFDQTYRISKRNFRFYNLYSRTSTTKGCYICA